MQERDIRLLFNSGHWSKVLIVPHQVDEGWQVLLFSQSEDEEPVVLSAKRGGPRIFKTSDTALIWCQQIGFDSVKVHLIPAEHSYNQSPRKVDLNSTILLVEDNQDDIDLTRYALKKNKITNEVVTKRDGAEALDYLFNDNKKQEDLPCFIILDLKLPKVSGLEVLKSVREDARTRSIPIVVLSTSTLDSDIQESYRIGSNSYIHKPTDIDEFCNVIKNMGTYWSELNLMPS